MYEVLSEYGTLVTAEAWQQWKHLIESNEKLIDKNVGKCGVYSMV
mgnify:CR=1 FL=1